ncbi:MAG: hypothetical protein F2732_00835 [Actinobacteria bacterium]|nr:hypothetical protein [Actinomycetota bacterium]
MTNHCRLHRGVHRNIDNRWHRVANNSSRRSCCYRKTNCSRRTSQLAPHCNL